MKLGVSNRKKKWKIHKCGIKEQNLEELIEKKSKENFKNLKNFKNHDTKMETQHTKTYGMQQK